jgi:hypothetical protein
MPTQMANNINYIFKAIDVYPSDNYGCPSAYGVQADASNFYCIFDDYKTAQAECNKDPSCKGYTYLSKELTKNNDEYRLTRNDPISHIFGIPSKYFEKKIFK